jgi:DNA modification methylase
LLEINKVHNLNCLEGLKQLDDNSIDCCVTSPPYWGLRDYGCDMQIGLEKTPEAYISKLVEVFREVNRVLKDEGTLWLNLGDSYAGSNRGAGAAVDPGTLSYGWSNKAMPKESLRSKIPGYKPKDLIGIPWMAAFALRADGWYLRMDNVWAKPNPMPESVTDRPTKSHEYMFLLSKSPHYYYDADAIKEPIVTPKEDKACHGFGAITGKYKEKYRSTKSGENWNIPEDGLRNKRSVWNIATKPYIEAHFATYPEELIEPCIKAGCPGEGIVLDPFMGSGTTGAVALRLNRRFIGFELNSEYIKLANKRIFSSSATLNMFIEKEKVLV